MNVAIIPARGGSKRIPRKNIRNFGGKPMIVWSIEAALRSGCLDRVVVSTDDKEIAELAQQHGAQVPFMRPEQLADDFTGTVPVVHHAVQWLLEHGVGPQYVCCIYATAPFITTADLREGERMLRESNAEYVFSVVRYDSPIQRALRITPQGRVEMLRPECFEARSQDLEPAYHDAAQFYWGRTDAWLAGKPVFVADSRPVVLPRHRVQDIDTESDWVRAELLLRALGNTPA